MPTDTNGQLWLFPFYSVAHSSEEFLLNLSMLGNHPSGGEFIVKLPNLEKHEKFVKRALSLGAYVTLRSPSIAMAKALIMLGWTEKNSFVCQECGAPANSHMECSCGTYAWCEKCEEDEEIETSPIIFDHADHDCSPECCERGHTAQKISAVELEARISKVQIFVEEQWPAENELAFTVRVRHKTDEERLEELEALMMQYCIIEIDGKLKTSIAYNLPTVEIGQKVLVTPHSMSSPTLALAIVRLNYRLVAQVIDRVSDWHYVLLLPEGITIPGHSTLSDDGNRHKIVLSRNEIEPTSR